MATDLTFLMKLQNEMSAEVKRINADMKELEGTTKDLDGTLGKAGGAAQQLGKQIDGTGKDADRAGGFMQKLARDTLQSAQDAEKAKGGFHGLGGALKDVTKIAAGVTVSTGILKLIDLGVKAAMVIPEVIGMASDLNESASKVATVFGPEQAKGMDAWAEAMAKMGTSKGDALAAVGTFGNFFATIGVNKDEAAGMSQSLVQLASDFASFNNASPVDVMDAMGAALRGEAEPMSRFGILMNDATLKAEAMKLGLIATEKDALTPAMKAQSAYNLMLSQAGAAYGDFGRTSDGLANRQRILSAQFANVKAEMGEKLLPVALTAVETFMEMVPAIAWVGDKLGDLAGKAGGVISPIREIVQDAKWLIENGRDMSIGNIAGADPTMVDKIAFAIKTAFFAFQDAKAAAGDFVEYLKPKLAEIAAAAQEQLGRFRAYIDSDLKPAFENIKAGIAATVDYIMSKWPLIAPVVEAAVTLVKGYIEGMWNVISGVVKIVVDLIGGDWDGAWENVKQLARDMVDNVIATLQNIGALIEAIVPLVKEVLTDLGKKMLEGIKAGIDNWEVVRDAIWEGVKKLPGMLGKVTDWLVDVGWDMMRGLANGIRDAAGDIVQAAMRFVSDQIPDWAKKFMGISSPSRVMKEQVGIPIAQGIAEGIYEGTRHIVRAAGAAAAAGVAAGRAVAANMGGYTYGGPGSTGGNRPGYIGGGNSLPWGGSGPGKYGTNNLPTREIPKLVAWLNSLTRAEREAWFKANPDMKGYLNNQGYYVNQIGQVNWSTPGPLTNDGWSGENHQLFLAEYYKNYYGKLSGAVGASPNKADNATWWSPFNDPYVAAEMGVTWQNPNSRPPQWMIDAGLDENGVPLWAKNGWRADPYNGFTYTGEGWIGGGGAAGMMGNGMFNNLAVLNAMRQQYGHETQPIPGGGGGFGPIHITVELDGKEIARAVKKMGANEVGAV